MYICSINTIDCMKFSAYKYLLAYLSPALVIFSLYQDDLYTFTSVAVLFGLLPALELFARGSEQNLTEIEEEIALRDKTYDLLLYGLVPCQYFILVLFLSRVSLDSVPFYAKFGQMMSFGMACGILGINAAHELGHRRTWYERLMSKMLLLTSQYMHFYIEHNRGHHKNVSTDEDPASSRLGENVYSFYVRSIRDSWLSAWSLENKRLRKEGKNPVSPANEMIRFQIIQAGLLVLILFTFGWETLGWYLGGASVGFLLLETVNYIEHYGLRRKKNGDRYERTMPVHSWNSNHPLGRLVLLELSRHSDHHFLASRKYQILRHFDESPQMPTGYPGMMMLSLVPPLWFRVMHREINKFKNKTTDLV